MTNEQKEFILKEFEYLKLRAASTTDNVDFLIENRAVHTFVNTVEGLFDIDFYKWIEENAIPNQNNRG